MSESDQVSQSAIWRTFCRAVGADVREATTIRGASGLDHRVQAIGLDEGRKRLIVISAEASARVAALMQVDVQASHPDFKVVVARPVIVDIGVLARRLFAGSPPRIPLAAVHELSEKSKAMDEDGRKEFFGKYFGDVMEPVVRGYKNAKLPTITQVLDLVSQGTQLDWAAIRDGIKSGSTDGYIDLTSVYNIDTTAIDRQHGVCALPLFEFSEADWKLTQSEGNIDEFQERLRQLDVYQYFFPPPDQVALGIVEQGIRDEKAIIEAIAMSPDLGHPLAAAELVPSLTDFKDSVDALKASGHLVEGEYGIDITSAGSAVRASVKIRPKEGFISKLLSRFNINLSASPGDFIP